LQYYPKREWVGLDSLVTIGETGEVIDLNTISDAEFRQFVLWRMGAASTERNQRRKRLSLESAPVRSPDDTRPPPPRQKMRPYRRRLTD